MKIQFAPIGMIHSPFTDLAQMPIQPGGGLSAPGSIEVLLEYIEGLRDLDGFSHILLLYHLHKAGKPRLLVTPFLDAKAHGVFATRAPVRPNPIGLSVVRLDRIEGNLLFVDGLDILDGTPLLDIKPYIPSFDERADYHLGWLAGLDRNAGSTLSDDRFKD